MQTRSPLSESLLKHRPTGKLIRIKSRPTKSYPEYSWYATCLGKVFRVIEATPENSKSSHRIQRNKTFVVVSELPSFDGKLIWKDDCDLISKGKPNGKRK